MKPHPEKNFIMECHNNEIEAEYEVMSLGVKMLRYECPESSALPG